MSIQDNLKQQYDLMTEREQIRSARRNETGIWQQQFDESGDWLEYVLTDQESEATRKAAEKREAEISKELLGLLRELESFPLEEKKPFAAEMKKLMSFPVF